MITRKNFMFASLSLVLCSVPAYAADPAICAEGWSIVFYDNGSLKSSVLKDNYDVNGIVCKNDYPISFYPDGELDSCDLYEDATVDSHSCKRDGRISFYKDGNIKSCFKPGYY